MNLKLTHQIGVHIHIGIFPINFNYTNDIIINEYNMILCIHEQFGIMF